MATTIWRLPHERHADSAFSGEGTRRHGGRFNSPGTPVVATTESLPLALVEAMTGLERYDQLRRYVFFWAGLPETLIFEVSEGDLPDGWDRHPPPPPAQRIGDRWVAQQRSGALRVPSVVVPYGHNYLLNPAHSSFEEVEIGGTEPFPVDQRPIPDP